MQRTPNWRVAIIPINGEFKLKTNDTQAEKVDPTLSVEK